LPAGSVIIFSSFITFQHIIALLLVSGHTACSTGRYVNGCCRQTIICSFRRSDASRRCASRRGRWTDWLERGSLLPLITGRRTAFIHWYQLYTFCYHVSGHVTRSLLNRWHFAS